MPIDKGPAAAIIARFSPSKPGGEGEGEEMEGEELTPELRFAAEDILVAIGQDFGSSPAASRSEREAFEEKAEHLAEALQAFFDLCDSLPHSEGQHE